MTIRYVDDPALLLQGRRVLVRADLDAPSNRDEGLLDDARVRAAVPTLRYLVDKGARVVVAAHRGNPRKRDPRLGMEVCGERLAELLATDVRFIDDCVGDGVRKLAGDLDDGEVLLLENLRFHGAEEAGDEVFARALAAGVDIFVNDALAVSHTEHASIHGVPRVIPEHVGGLALRADLAALDRVLDKPERPFVAVVGGAVLGEHVALLNRVMGVADTLVLGGGTATTILHAAGTPTGDSPVDAERLRFAAQLLERCKDRGITLHLPADHVVSPAAGVSTTVADVVGNGLVSVDLGPRTRARYGETIAGARTVLWVGPMGARAGARDGDTAVLEAMVHARGHGAYTVVVGEEGAARVAALDAGDRVGHVVPGGDAARAWLEQRALPGLQVLEG